MVYQHDPRHVDVLVKDLGLEHGNSVQTPATHDATEEEEPEPLSQVQHSKYRSQVARCLFLSLDRADITFILNELCQRMSSPSQQTLAELKRLVRYLKRYRQWGQTFGYGRLHDFACNRSTGPVFNSCCSPPERRQLAASRHFAILLCLVLRSE